MDRIKEWFKGLSLARVVPWFFLFVLVILAAYQYIQFKEENTLLAGENNSLAQNLRVANEENSRLEQELRDKLYIIESFENQINEMLSVVGNLQKLSETDEELLRKYSKISFLNENYVPARLAEIDTEYTLVKNDTDTLIHADVLPYLLRLVKAARNNDIELFVSSAFRSFDTQASLKSGYTVIYGAGANKFSADQGFSEHQLGTTVDFATVASGAASTKFETDPAYKWLNDNAYRYGFVLSYPKGNSYYMFEPWHWRFVGIQLATKLHNENKNFYDMDQREIDKYLINLFD